MAKKKRSYKRKAARESDLVIEQTPKVANPEKMERPQDWPPPPEPVLQTTEAQPQNTMMRYGRNPKCPRCNAYPLVCMMRRPGYKKYRCRACEYQFEVFE